MSISRDHATVLRSLPDCLATMLLGNEPKGLNCGAIWPVAAVSDRRSSAGSPLAREEIRSWRRLRPDS
jgi:hypothetical protein